MRPHDGSSPIEEEDLVEGQPQNLSHAAAASYPVRLLAAQRYAVSAQHQPSIYHQLATSGVAATAATPTVVAMNEAAALQHQQYMLAVHSLSRFPELYQNLAGAAALASQQRQAEEELDYEEDDGITILNSRPVTQSYQQLAYDPRTLAMARRPPYMFPTSASAAAAAAALQEQAAQQQLLAVRAANHQHHRQQHQQQHQVITIDDSDEDEDEEEEPEEEKKPPPQSMPEQKRKAEIIPRTDRSEPDDTVTKRPRVSANLPTVQPQAAALHRAQPSATSRGDPRHAWSQTRHHHSQHQQPHSTPPRGHAALRSARPDVNRQNVATTTRPHARPPTDQEEDSSTSLAGSFIKGVLRRTLSQKDLDVKMHEVSSKILYLVSSNRGHDPAEKTIKVGQGLLDMVAMEMLSDRQAAVENAVGTALEECQSRHEMLVESRAADLVAKNLGSKPDGLHLGSNSHARQLAQAKIQHETEMEALRKEHALEVALLKEKMAEARRNQARSLNAYMKASVHSLRLMRKKSLHGTKSK